MGSSALLHGRDPLQPRVGPCPAVRCRCPRLARQRLRPLVDPVERDRMATGGASPLGPPAPSGPSRPGRPLGPGRDHLGHQIGGSVQLAVVPEHGRDALALDPDDIGGHGLILGEDDSRRQNGPCGQRPAPRAMKTPSRPALTLTLSQRERGFAPQSPWGAEAACPPTPGKKATWSGHASRTRGSGGIRPRCRGAGRRLTPSRGHG